jgi:hypothetical protein
LIEVARDYDGIRIAAREWYEEAHRWPRVQRKLLLHGRTIDNREAYIRSELPQLTVAAGYYSWVSYLAWLDRVHEIACFRDLTADEAEGLRVLRDARNEFLSKHAHCPKCGGLNDKGAIGCADCGAKFG